MKKLLTLLLAAAMLLTLCACGSSPAPQKPIEEMDDEDWEAAAEALEDMYEEEPVVETEPAEKIYELGETILSADGMLELTIDEFVFADAYDYNTDRPAVEGEEGAVLAHEGKTYLFYFGTIEFVGESKQVRYYNIHSNEVDYNDGYKFSYLYSYTSEIGYNGPADERAYFEPLTGTKIREIRGHIEVAEVVESDTDGSILLSMVLNNGCSETNYFEQQKITVRLR